MGLSSPCPPGRGAEAASKGREGPGKGLYRHRTRNWHSRHHSVSKTSANRPDGPQAKHAKRTNVLFSIASDLLRLGDLRPKPQTPAQAQHCTALPLALAGCAAPDYRRGHRAGFPPHPQACPEEPVRGEPITLPGAGRGRGRPRWRAGRGRAVGSGPPDSPRSTGSGSGGRGDRSPGSRPPRRRRRRLRPPQPAGPRAPPHCGGGPARSPGCTIAGGRGGRGGGTDNPAPPGEERRDRAARGSLGEGERRGEGAVAGGARRVRLPLPPRAVWRWARPEPPAGPGRALWRARSDGGGRGGAAGGSGRRAAAASCGPGMAGTAGGRAWHGRGGGSGRAGPGRVRVRWVGRGLWGYRCGASRGLRGSTRGGGGF